MNWTEVDSLVNLEVTASIFSEQETMLPDQGMFKGEL